MTLSLPLPTRFVGRLLLCVLSGTLLTASFPPGHLSFLAWVALVPFLLAIHGEAPRQAFKLGCITGFVHYMTLIYWVIVVLGQYGKLPPAVCVSALILLSIYLSLYPGLFAFLACRLQDRRLSAFFMAALWVSLEYLRGKLLTGFPWCLMGYSQYEHLALIQVADISGVYGISFLIVLVNMLLFQTFCSNGFSFRTFLKWEWFTLFLVLAGVLGYGFHQKHNMAKKPVPQVKAAVIQANIDQSVKWKPAYQVKTMTRYFSLTRSLKNTQADLIVWPETALPFFFQNSRWFSAKIMALSNEMNAVMVFGSPAYERSPNEIRYYNRAYMAVPGLKTPLYYDKKHLVPFGEYVPFKRYLPFLHRLVQAAGDFAQGEKTEPLRHKRMSLGILICFEAIFPEMGRHLAKQGANLLVNLTNDAWFGRSSAPYQHLSMAVFRTVENRIPMVRAANTGISAFIGPDGKILSESDIFEQSVLVYSVPVNGPAHTFYTRFGDVFAWGMILITFIAILLSFQNRFKDGKSRIFRSVK